MDFPPPTYGLLLGATLLLLPLVSRAGADPARRRLARDVLVGLAVLECALIVLFYSKLACWMLAGAASVFLVARAGPTRWPAALGIAGPPALAAGLLFQFLPGEGSFVVYFTLGLPVIIGLPMALLGARWLAGRPGPGTIAAAVGASTLAGLVATSSYSLGFLELFEAAHLPALLASAAGLAWLVGRAERARRRDVADAWAAPNPGDYAGRPGPASAWTLAFVAGSALVAAAWHGYALWSHVGAVSNGAVGVGAAALSLVLVLAHTVVVWRWKPGAALAGCAAALASALLIPLAPATLVFLDGQDAPLAAALTASAIAGTLAWAALAGAIAQWRDAWRRARVATDALPAGMHLDAGQRVPTISELERRADTLRSRQAQSASIAVDAPAHSPFWTLPEDVHAWLLAQPPGAPRVHVMVREGPDVYVVPPLVPEELEE